MADPQTLLAKADTAHWYKSSNIRELIEHCREIPAPLYRETIIALLLATERFRSASSTTEYWTWVRNKHTPEEQLLENLHNMAAAFDKAEQLKKTAEQTHNDQDYQALNVAIAYCRNSIKSRLTELNPSDKFIKLYKQVMAEQEDTYYE